jgi:hypothetical protein
MFKEKRANQISMIKVAPIFYFGLLCGGAQHYFQWSATGEVDMPPPIKVNDNLPAFHGCTLLPFILETIGSKEKMGNEKYLIFLMYGTSIYSIHL